MYIYVYIHASLSITMYINKDNFETFMRVNKIDTRYASNQSE